MDDETPEQLLVYATKPYGLELYTSPPGPGVDPVSVRVPRGLWIMSVADHELCKAQPRFVDTVKPLPGKTLAQAWAAVPRKRAVAMVDITYDVATLETLLGLDHHLDVREAVAAKLGQLRAA